MNEKLRLLRERMVDEQIRARGVEAPAVLEAMRKVPRHLFVPIEARGEAYEDRPLGIGFGQTISQPYMVAYMTEKLELSGNDKVLEIGTGSGYQTAVLALTAKQVFTIEVEPALSRRAMRLLSRLGLGKVKARVGNGLAGWKDAAPFDRILVTAGVEKDPLALLRQLKLGGRLIAPVGPTGAQKLQMYDCRKDGWPCYELMPVVFVPSHEAPPNWMFGKN